VKILPYSNAPMTIKIDAEGPLARQTLGTGANAKDCNIKLGQSWKDMLATCVNITGDQTLDKQNFNKLVGGRIHTLDDIFFNVVGVNQNVTVQKATYDYVKDTDLPATPTRPRSGSSTSAPAARTPTSTRAASSRSPTSTCHGTALVWREYAASRRRSSTASPARRSRSSTTSAIRSASVRRRPARRAAPASRASSSPARLRQRRRNRQVRPGNLDSLFRDEQR